MPHRLIGWLTRLPQDWELRFRQELTKLQGTETVMMTTDSIPSFIEIQERRQAIVDVLEARFAVVPDDVRAKVQGLSDGNALRQALRLASTAPTLQDFLQNALK